MNECMYECAACVTCNKVEPLMFTQCLEDMTVNCAARVKLTCELSKPRLSVQWKKDGRLLYVDNDRLSTDCNGRLHQLVIKQVDLDDAGEYTAVYNHLFTAATLTVLSESCNVQCSAHSRL